MSANDYKNTSYYAFQLFCMKLYVLYVDMLKINRNMKARTYICTIVM